MPEREIARRGFVAAHGWDGARCHPLAGDASARRYFRLVDAARGSAVVMDAPPELCGSIAPFCAVDAHLRGLNLSAPEIYARDPEHGFLLLEDLGDDLFARRVAAENENERPLYRVAADVLIHLQSRAPAADLPAYDGPAMVAAITPAFEWYRRAAIGAVGDPAPVQQALGDLLARFDRAPPAMALRDYHAENLIWLPARAGPAQVGLLDFQDAVLAHPALDLVSLCQDARRDVTPETEAATIAHYLDATGHDAGPFRRAYALIGAQRHLRLLGVLTKLALRDGKPRYLSLLPRVWRDLQRDLARPELARLAGAVALALPAPTQDLVERIARTCPPPPKP